MIGTGTADVLAVRRGTRMGRVEREELDIGRAVGETAFKEV